MHRLAFASLLAVATLAGCSNDPPLGDIEIPFELGVIGAACADVGVAEIRMQVTQVLEEGTASPQSETAACEDGKVLFTGINAGTYDLVVEGLAADGTVIYDNLGESALKRVEVLEDTTVTAGTVTLTPTPARVMVGWQLTKGGFAAQCANVATKQFQVSLARSGGTQPLGPVHVFACDHEAEDFPYHLVPDPMRQIDGELLDTIVVQPQDGAGASIGAKVIVQLAASPGHGRAVRVIVNCVDDVCTGELRE